MKRLMIAGMLLGGLTAMPVHALEHQTTISHPASGEIAADYKGSTRTVTRQVGMPAPGGRPSSLSCVWSVSLTVERVAVAGAGMQATRSMTRERALTGKVPGWCSSSSNQIEGIVEARRENLRATMMAMVSQDRAVILAEVDAARDRAREG